MDFPVLTMVLHVPVAATFPRDVISRSSSDPGNKIFGNPFGSSLPLKYANVVSETLLPVPQGTSQSFRRVRRLSLPGGQYTAESMQRYSLKLSATCVATKQSVSYKEMQWQASRHGQELERENIKGTRTGDYCLASEPSPQCDRGVGREWRGVNTRFRDSSKERS